MTKPILKALILILTVTCTASAVRAQQPVINNLAKVVLSHVAAPDSDSKPGTSKALPPPALSPEQIARLAEAERTLKLLEEQLAAARAQYTKLIEDLQVRPKLNPATYGPNIAQDVAPNHANDNATPPTLTPPASSSGSANGAASAGGAHAELTASTVKINGPAANTNATLSNPYALHIESGYSLLNGQTEIREAGAGETIKVANTDSIFNIHAKNYRKQWHVTYTNDEANAQWGMQLNDHGVLSWEAYPPEGGPVLSRVWFRRNGGISLRNYVPVHIFDVDNEGRTFLTRHRVRVGGTLKVDTTTVGNVGSGENDLTCYTIPAGILANDGDYLEIHVFGTFAYGAAKKSIKGYLDGALILAADPEVNTTGRWSIKAKIIRTGADAQKLIVDYQVGNNFTSDYKTLSKPLDKALVFQITGEGMSNDDIVQQGMVIQWFPAGN